MQLGDHGWCYRCSHATQYTRAPDPSGAPPPNLPFKGMPGAYRQLAELEVDGGSTSISVSLVFPIVEEAIGGRGAARRVLPAREPPLVVVAQLRAGGRPCAGRGVVGRATRHIADGIIAGGVGRTAAANAGDGVQMGAIAIGVAAQGATGEAVQGVIGERLRVTGGARGCPRVSDAPHEGCHSTPPRPAGSARRSRTPGCPCPPPRVVLTAVTLLAAS